MSKDQTTDFTTNGYPDPQVFWDGCRAYIRRAEARLGWIDHERRQSRLLRMEMAKAGVKETEDA